MRSIGIVALCFLGSDIAIADSVCDVAVTKQAFDTTESSAAFSLVSALRDDICSRDYSSVEDARSKARSSGFSLSYAGLGIGANDAKTNAANRKEIKDTAFCKATESDFAAAYNETHKEQVASIAVRAWEQCIKITQANQLYLKYEIEENNSLFAGTLIKTSSTGALASNITGISVVGSAAPFVSCNVGGRKFAMGELGEIDYRLTTTRTAFSCEKHGEGIGEHVSIVIQTAADSLPPVHLPSARQIREDRLDKIEEKMTSDYRKILTLLAEQGASFDEKVVASSTSINERIDGIRLTAKQSRPLPDFACGGSASAEPNSLEVMYGSKDGTGCRVRNINYVKTIEIDIPPSK